MFATFFHELKQAACASPCSSHRLLRLAAALPALRAIATPLQRPFNALVIGVVLLRTDDTSQSLIERADNCLYAAKRQGVITSFARATPRPNRAPILKPHRLPGWRSHHCEIARASLAGSSWTDSPQPQAEVWFGLLNTN
jgi:GGDEF domain-containing protein